MRTVASLILAALCLLAATGTDARSAANLLQTGSQRFSHGREVRAKNASVRAAKIVESLKEHALELRKQSNKEFRERQRDLGRQLDKITAESNATKAGNAKRASELGELKRANDALRKTAGELLRDCNSLDDFARNLIANMTTLDAKIAYASRMATLRNNASALDVLNELDAENTMRSEEAERQRKLKAVAKGRPTLLQVSSVSDPEHAEELIAAFSKSLEDVTRTQAVNMEEMERSLNAAIEVGKQELDKVLQQQARLDAELSAQKVLMKRLNDAITHLKLTNKNLLERNKGLRRFMRHVALDANLFVIGETRKRSQHRNKQKRLFRAHAKRRGAHHHRRASSK